MSIVAGARIWSGNIVEGMAVVQQTTASMVLTISQGSCQFDVGTYPSSYRISGWIDTTTGTPAGETVTVGTAPTSNSRIDAVVGYLDFSATTTAGTADNNNAVLKLMVVAGTVAASPVAPTNSAIQAAVGASNPYTRLANVTVGTNVTQLTNSNIADTRSFIVLARNPYKFSVYRNAAFVTGAGAPVLFDTKSYDAGNNVDIVVNKGRFTAPTACYVRFEAALTLVYGGAGNSFSIALYKNGSLAKQGTQLVSTAAQTICGNVSGELQLAANDYVEVYSLGTSATGTVGSGYTFFDGSIISAT